jgi:hypothetical protein
MSRSSKASTFGFFIFLIGLLLIGWIFFTSYKGRLPNNTIINIAGYLTIIFGVIWAYIGIGLMGNKKWLAKPRIRLQWISFVIILVQFIAYSVFNTDDFEEFYVAALAIFEGAFFLILLLPVLNSRKVIDSLIRQ